MMDPIWFGLALMALGVIAGILVMVIIRIGEIHADLQRMSAEIHALAKSHVEMAHVLNEIQSGISQAHAVLSEHDQIIAFMRHEQETDYPVH